MQLSVSYQRNGDLHTIHTGGAALGDIVIDNSECRPNSAAARPSASGRIRLVLLLRGPEFRAGKPGRPL